jgi:hypothetical protein
MRPDEIYRESARRSHKLLGAYLALWAWTNEVDCVVLIPTSLFSYLGLKGSMRSVRLKWMEEDLKKLFPHFKTLQSASNRSFATLILSRMEIPPNAMRGTMNVFQRVERLEANGLKASFIGIPPESEIIKMMAELSHGISDFSDLEGEAK